MSAASHSAPPTSAPDALDAFHPAVATWFRRALGAPTPPQTEAWPHIATGRDTLIAAPTGSGKTLAAFLAAIDELIREGLRAPLPDETRVVYVTPLKALSNDVHVNLEAPLAGIRAELVAQGHPEVEVRAAVRTGDTPQKERVALPKRPPHILVTTPESFYLLLTSESGRGMLATTRTVILDEIHAVAGNKRGAHLALSVERLDHLTGGKLRRVGLSATQKPVEEVARLLVGAGRCGTDGTPRCAIVNVGHRRDMDLALELPRAPLEAVMSNEVWTEVHDRLCQLIDAHRTTLIFVNTRRLAERLTHQLSERLGPAVVATHHGSLSTERRHDAEQRLKAGKLRALVATASLELGIDIGSVELVCQLGTTRTIATFLQRVGRSGHHLGATPKGRLFPLTRDELVEACALFTAVRRGDLDELEVPRGALDILAQQIVAMVGSEEWHEDALYDLVRRVYPYRDVSPETFRAILEMLADGFALRRGRRGAYVHHDAVNKMLRPRRGARLAALTSGGAIPDNADYAVVLDPTATRIGSINEDFAIESVPGDIFLLGNASWQITKVEAGVVRVVDAAGHLPTLPFWLGEAPSRSAELSAAVSSLRAELEPRLADRPAAQVHLEQSAGVEAAAAEQVVAYLGAAEQCLGALPTQNRIIVERFFDESGGMQLVVHSPFGSRINRAWGLALRKSFCRAFNFELQAAATEDAFVLSLGEEHSFPLSDVFRFLHPNTVRDVLVQALLAAPMFQTRWRWNASRSLALLRRRGGRVVPAAIRRMEAEDLVAAVFPDQLACAENLVGDRQIPDHPLVQQTIDDCLTEAMDFAGFLELIERVTSGRIELVARDLPEPSPLAHEILGARPYAFLDDAPLEERRTRAVLTRRSLDSTARELGALDPKAIQTVADEVFPQPRDADELHDALGQLGMLSDAERVERWSDLEVDGWLDGLASARRAVRLTLPHGPHWVATEKVPDLQRVFPGMAVPDLALPERLLARAAADRDAALRELVRGRLEASGPTTAAGLASTLGVAPSDINLAFHALESEGFVLRGSFTAEAIAGTDEWCERRVLQRIHRLTLNRLRAEIEPVSLADFQRFLFTWQHLTPDEQARGPEGLAAVLALLDGFVAPAAAWEPELLARRVADYNKAWLDGLTLSGRVGWGRLAGTSHGAGPVASTPISLYLREGLPPAAAPETAELSTSAQRLAALLGQRGALFFRELSRAAGLLPAQVEDALAELVARGLVTSDSFAGLRALLLPAAERRPSRAGRPHPLESGGRWSLVHPLHATPPDDDTGDLAGAATPEEERTEAEARRLLRRYGVVFRALVGRESLLSPWRDIVRVLRRLEARGELRGGRFVSGPSGEQYALPEAVGLLRKLRREAGSELVVISAADPLNLLGVVSPGPRLTAQTRSRILFEAGVPIAVREGGETRRLPADTRVDDATVETLLRKPVRPGRDTLLRGAFPLDPTTR